MVALNPVSDILPISLSCSLIANVKSPADVVRFSTVPISSCNSLIADKAVVVITFTAWPLVDSLLNSIMCATESSLTDIEDKSAFPTEAVAKSYPKILKSELALNVPTEVFTRILLVFACNTTPYQEAFASTVACVVLLALS